MKLKIIFGVLMLSLAFSSLQAQGRRDGFDVEKHHQARTDFFIKELNLTEKEQKEFIPLMHDYFHARYALSKGVRDTGRGLRKKETRTEEECQRLIDLIVDTKIAEAQLQKEYYAKFRKVLPAEKVLRYYRAEMDFMQQAVKHRHQERKGRRTN